MVGMMAGVMLAGVKAGSVMVAGVMSGVMSGVMFGVEIPFQTKNSKVNKDLCSTETCELRICYLISHNSQH